MSYKSTQRINRERALAILAREIPALSNDSLASLLDQLADDRACEGVSMFDNFIVSEFSDSHVNG